MAEYIAWENGGPRCSNCSRVYVRYIGVEFCSFCVWSKQQIAGGTWCAGSASCGLPAELVCEYKRNIEFKDACKCYVKQGGV